MGLDPALVVVIEDSHIGLTAAKAAGMNCLVRTPRPPPDSVMISIPNGTQTESEGISRSWWAFSISFLFRTEGASVSCFAHAHVWALCKSWFVGIY